MTGMLEGKVALISGCGAGIGEAAARLFAKNGAKLWLNDRRDDAFNRVVNDLLATGATVSGVAGDMSDPKFVNSWVQGAVDSFGRIDVLYNNVGVSRSGLIGDLSDADWRLSPSGTLRSVLYFTPAAVPHTNRPSWGANLGMAALCGARGHSNPCG